MKSGILFTLNFLPFIKKKKVKHTKEEVALINKINLQNNLPTLIHQSKKLRLLTEGTLHVSVINKLLSQINKMDDPQLYEVLVIIEGSLLDKHLPFFRTIVAKTNCNRTQEETFMRLTEFKDSPEKMELLHSLKKSTHSEFIKRAGRNLKIA